MWCDWFGVWFTSSLQCPGRFFWSVGTCANVLVLLSGQEGSSKHHTTLCIPSWVLFLSVLPQPDCSPEFWRWEPGSSPGWVSWLLPRKPLQLREWLGWKAQKFHCFLVPFVGFLTYFSAVSEGRLFSPGAELFPGSCLPAAWLVRQADKEFQVLISLSVVWKAVGFSGNTAAVTGVVLSRTLEFSVFQRKEVTFQDLQFLF